MSDGKVVDGTGERALDAHAHATGMRYPKGVGDVVGGKYRLDSVLGSSGMGVVFSATHLQIEQKVAIKFLLDKACAVEETVRRFALEAKVMGKIRSRHVVQVLDVGTVDGNVPYIVMEYLLGEDLARAARGEELTANAAIRYMLEACEGLAAAHAVGVIHRDIKPSNLFIATEPDGTRALKVIDFGVAKFRGVDTNPSQSDGLLTQTSTIIGSPRYMSPEQATESRNVDASSDVWSLGVILHELLVGAPLFKAESFTQVLVNVLSMPIPHPSDASPHVPRALGDVVMRALMRERDKRTPTVEQLANELAPFAGQEEGERLLRIRHVVESSASVRAVHSTDPSGLVARGVTLANEPSEPRERIELEPAETRIAQVVSSSVRRRKRRLAALVAVGAGMVAAGLLTMRHPAAPTTQAVAAPVPATTVAVASPVQPTQPREVRVRVPAGARVLVDGAEQNVEEGEVVLRGMLGSAHEVKATVDGRSVESLVAITENGPLPPALALPPHPSTATVAPSRGGPRATGAAPPLPKSHSGGAAPPAQTTGLVRSFE